MEIFDLLLNEFSICSFDFSGAGNSDGKYVTLGYEEVHDLDAVLTYLKKSYGIKKYNINKG
jgi:alpha/beta superfamily hydrolase